MKLTPIQKRAERKARNHQGLDMNLVALIDIFTILIFFLMSSTGIVARTKSWPSSVNTMPSGSIAVSFDSALSASSDRRWRNGDGVAATGAAVSVIAPR